MRYLRLQTAAALFFALVFICASYVSAADNDSKPAAQKELPKCNEWSFIGWNNCVGTRKYEQARITYTGEFIRNYPVGRGKIEYWDTGETYVGEYKNGAPNGMGMKMNRNGFKYYEGTLKNGEFMGRGIRFFELHA